MSTSPNIVSYADFIQRFRPISSGIVEGEISRAMYATYGQDLARVRGADARHVWTVIDVELPAGEPHPYEGETGDNCWLIVPGFHYVNRIAHMITAMPWEDDCMEVVY